MGSSYSWRLTIEDRNVTLNDQIVNTANSMKDFSDPRDYRFQNWMWFRWCPEVKWWAGDFVTELSKKFPETVFRLDCRGDDQFTWFYLNGDCVSESQVWKNPPFPSRPLMKKTITRERKSHIEQEQAAAIKKAESERLKLEAELASLQKKQAELTEQLIHMSK